MRHTKVCKIGSICESAKVWKNLGDRIADSSKQIYCMYIIWK